MPRHHEPPPPQCVVLVGDRRCHNAGRFSPDGSPHLHMCGIHRNQHAEYVRLGAGVHPAGQCLHVVRHAHGPARYTWCQNPIGVENPYCEHHRGIRRRQAQVDAIAPGVAGVGVPVADWLRLVNLAEDDLEEAHWQEALRLFQERRAAAAAGAADAGGVIAGIMAAHRDVVAAHFAPAPPVPELGRLARDRQNVHDGQVNRLTNEGIDRLCAVAVPAGQDTLRLATHAFTGFADVSYMTSQPVLADIVNWWNTDHCRTMAPIAPDYLYKRTLTGLVAYIERVESAETKAELWRRLFQEAQESVGMCCDGHLARLVNVLVGFDEAFRPPVSQGELIQNRISAIAGLDVSDEERVRQANAFFDEIAVPEAERAPWIEALA